MNTQPTAAGTEQPMSLVTCSYRPDFQRCENLCASVDQYVGREHHHTLVVPDRDLPLFRRLQSHRRSVVAVQDILPASYHQLPGLKKWWLDSGIWPVRGWMMQQLTKLSADQLCYSEDILFLDSDVEFIRPLDRARFSRDGALRLHRKPGEGSEGVHLKWHHTSAELLGLSPRYFGGDYVAALTSWRRSNLVAMKAHIEQTTGRAWQSAVGRQLTVSEYTLYGVFVEHVLGLENAGHFACADDLCHCLWFGRDTEQFLSQLDYRQPPQAVLVQSNIGLEQHKVDALIGQIRNQLAAA
jgi:hypothetical protein